MSDLASPPGAQLLALTLARALNSELPNTRETCLRHASSAALASELAEAESLVEGILGEIYILRSFLRPINRLPPELLAHIFGFLGAGCFVVPASHVCQRWRNIALSIPALWTVIREDDDVFAAKCFMERSKNMMLDVSFVIDMRGKGFREFQFVVAPYASRIKRLHVEVYGDRVYDFYCLLAARDFEMPALEHFSIRMIEYGFQDDSRDGPCKKAPSSAHRNPSSD
ncbi:hypothetical protein BC826DRAFT_485188 [Russula brevipes]|nr:hypothetical protein BC826DRAFT_485188 [Russula brevipes]